MWINQKNAWSDEKQDSIQKLENRLRSGGLENLLSITKSPGFSQSLLGVPMGGDIIWQKPNITQVGIY
jgi:hypothetical protein